MTNHSTHLVGLIGADLGLSLARIVQEQEARELGVDYHYRVFDAHDDAAHADLATTLAWLREQGYRGTNVTHPFKKTVVALLDELSPDAEALGAVNTVVFSRDGRMLGHNTDWYGFARSFQVDLADAGRRKVVQLGAGGAGVAVAHALLRAGAKDLVLLSRNAASAEASADSLHRIHSRATIRTDHLAALADHLPAADGLVNATPIGMPAHPGSPVPAELLRRDLWVHDIVYMPMKTALLREARAAGCSTVDGGGMFVHQAAENFRLFTGIRPDPRRMLRHLRRIVESGSQGAPVGR
jgi:shikimate dehydrogenase